MGAERLPDGRGDRDLLAAWRAGDRPAFDRLMERYEARLMTYLVRMTRSRQEAEDLFQETFLRVYRAGGPRGRGPEEPAAPFDFHLMRIARNLAVSRSRRGGVERAGLAAVRPMQPPGAPDTLAESEAGTAAREALDALPADLREAVSLKVWGEMSWRQIGELLGTSEDTAARRCAEGLDLLAKNLAPRLGGSP
jgi:RNA polymerase sigma-70 factor (ECF subfamily)